MKKSFDISKKMSGRFAATLATVLVAITLVACGGGGGSPAVTPDTPVVITPPVVVTPPVASFTCWNTTKAASKDACPVVTAPTVTLNSVSDPVVTFASGAVSTGGTLTGNAGAITLVYGVQPSGSVLQSSGSKAYTTMYTYSLVVNYSNGPSQTVTGAYTTGASPSVVAAIGVDQLSPKVLPFESGTTVDPIIGSATWATADTTGVIQTFDTGMIITGLPSVRAVALVGKFFISPVTGAVCTTLVYKDTGLSIYADPRTYGGCKSTPFDRVRGTADGYIRHYPSVSICEKITWDIPTANFKAENITCS